MLVRRTAIGAASGFVATVPMTVAMLALQRMVPERPPPEEITRRAATRAGLGDELQGREEMALASLVTHFGFGAASGGTYGLLPHVLPVAPMTRGIFFGLLVWTVNYLGWLPASGLFPHATRRSRADNVRMIIAHIVWGATLGALTQSLAPRRSRLRLQRPTSDV